MSDPGRLILKTIPLLLCVCVSMGIIFLKERFEKLIQVMEWASESESAEQAAAGDL